MAVAHYDGLTSNMLAIGAIAVIDTDLNRTYGLNVWFTRREQKMV